MGNYRAITWIALSCLAPACGGAESAGQAPAQSPVTKASTTRNAEPSHEAKPSQAAAPKAAPADAELASGELTHEVPTSCSGADGCVPDSAFAETVCRGKFPNLPFAMFAKSAPWQHLYVKAVTVEPVNAYGGPRSEVEMNFGEEVVVLHKHGPGKSTGVQISGPTDLDVLRWDGTCATVREEMFTKYNPGQMTTPRIVWKYLDDPIRETLLKGPVVERAQSNERKQCRESSAKNPSPECERAMLKLTEAIIVAVRMGTVLPAPTAPEWRKPEATASR